MLSLNSLGEFDISKECQESIDSKIAHIYPNNIIYPERTMSRLVKYNYKYGIKFLKSEVLAVSSLFNCTNQLEEILQFCIDK